MIRILTIAYETKVPLNHAAFYDCNVERAMLQRYLAEAVAQSVPAGVMTTVHIPDSGDLVAALRVYATVSFDHIGFSTNPDEAVRRVAKATEQAEDALLNAVNGIANLYRQLSILGK